MDNTFVWTDDLVKEYIKYLQQGEGCGKWHPMEEFKKSKEVKKEIDYEIVDYETNHWEPNYDKSHTIKSVKRLSDGEVFSIKSDFKGCPQRRRTGNNFINSSS